MRNPGGEESRRRWKELAKEHSGKIAEVLLGDGKRIESRPAD
jgi:hypothetical protein